MVDITLASVLRDLLTLAILGIGSVIIWVTLGRWIVRREVRTFGMEALEKGITRAYKNPEGRSGQMIGKLSQLGVSFALNSLSELIPENPNQPAHPLVNSMFRRFEDHAMKSMSAMIGNMMKKGMETSGIAPGGELNPAALLGQLGGGTGGKNQFSGLMELLPLLQMMGQGQASTPARQTGASGWL